MRVKCSCIILLLIMISVVCARSHSSGQFDDARRHVHVGDQQHLNGMAHEQQENWQQPGHGAVAAVAVLHGSRVFTCQSRYFRYHIIIIVIAARVCERKKINLKICKYFYKENYNNIYIYIYIIFLYYY
jgi:hypothetical protein